MSMMKYIKKEKKRKKRAALGSLCIDLDYVHHLLFLRIRIHLKLGAAYMTGQQHLIELKLYGIMYERLGAAGSIPAVHHDFSGL